MIGCEEEMRSEDSSRRRELEMRRGNDSVVGNTRRKCLPFVIAGRAITRKDVEQGEEGRER